MDKYGASKVTVIGHENINKYRYCPNMMKVKPFNAPEDTSIKNYFDIFLSALI